MPNEILNEFLRPLQHRQPEDRVQFGQGAALQQFAKPTPLFEHDTSTILMRLVRAGVVV